MAQKRTASLTNHLNDGVTNSVGNPQVNRIPIPFRSVQLPVMIFLNWIDPPVGFTMNNAIDPNHPSYRVRLMNVGTQGGGPSLIVPFTETVAWKPSAAPLTLWQFQMVGVPNIDPTALQYYETMTVPQGPPGSQTVRSRIFVPPQTAQFAGIQPVVSGSLNVLGGFQVQGVVDVTNTTLPSVAYAHVQISDNTDPTGPRDLFLQQPLS
jgi:hypothetical protein